MYFVFQRYYLKIFRQLGIPFGIPMIFYGCQLEYRIEIVRSSLRLACNKKGCIHTTTVNLRSNFLLVNHFVSGILYIQWARSLPSLQAETKKRIIKRSMELGKKTRNKILLFLLGWPYLLSDFEFIASSKTKRCLRVYLRSIRVLIERMWPNSMAICLWVTRSVRKIIAWLKGINNGKFLPSTLYIWVI